MVCGGVISGEKFICLMIEIVGDTVASSDLFETSISAGSISGSEAPPSDQNSAQKSNSFSTTPPFISIHPSNQLSQLTLQDGMNANLRSIRINLGCMTLNGRTNTLLTIKSRPISSVGDGNPRLGHDEGG